MENFKEMATKEVGEMFCRTGVVSPTIEVMYQDLLEYAIEQREKTLIFESLLTDEGKRIFGFTYAIRDVNEREFFMAARETLRGMLFENLTK